jgi:hypothetical protein
MRKSSPIPSRSPDTSAAAERVQVNLFRAAPVSRRLQVALSLTATVISTARRALERNGPTAPARERDLRFVEVHYGREIADALRAELAGRGDEPSRS